MYKCQIKIDDIINDYILFPILHNEYKHT